MHRNFFVAMLFYALANESFGKSTRQQKDVNGTCVIGYGSMN